MENGKNIIFILLYVTVLNYRNKIIDTEQQNIVNKWEDHNFYITLCTK